MSASSAEITRLKQSGDLFAAQLDSLRELVHRVCKGTGADKTCPYRIEHGETDFITCEMCPYRQESKDGVKDR